MDRTRRDRMLELKFLGSGLSTAAAKKKFAKVRKEITPAPGRAGTQALGTQARLRNAEAYLAQRAKREAPRKAATKAAEAAITRDLSKLAKAGKMKVADLRAEWDAWLAKNPGKSFDDFKKLKVRMQLADQEWARRSVMDNTDAFSAKRKKVTGMAAKPDVFALAEKLKTADAAALKAMSRDLSGLSREELVDVANRAGFPTPQSATKKAVLDRINRRAADRTWWAGRAPNPSAA